MNKTKITQSFQKTINYLQRIVPILLGVIMAISLFIVLIPKSFYRAVFTGKNFFDPLIGACLGSVAAGNPITSYIIGGELLKEGVSLIAVVAFILSWVTVGIVQLPAESLILGRKFALIRNLFSFISAIIIAILTVLTLSIL